MVRVLIFLLIISTVHSLKAQDQTKTQRYTYGAITLSPLTATTPGFKKWKAGYLYTINKKLKVGLDAALGLEDMPQLDDHEYNNYVLWEIRPEVYHIFNPNNKYTHWYISTSWFYINHKESLSNGSYKLKNEFNGINYESADYQRQKYGMHMKLGFFSNIQDRFQLNMALGVGGRVRNTKFYNVVTDNTTTEHFGYLYFLDPREVKGTSYGLDIFMDFKFVYRLSKL